MHLGGDEDCCLAAMNVCAKFGANSSSAFGYISSRDMFDLLVDPVKAKVIGIHPPDSLNICTNCPTMELVQYLRYFTHEMVVEWYSIVPSARRTWVWFPGQAEGRPTVCGVYRQSVSLVNPVSTRSLKTMVLRLIEGSKLTVKCECKWCVHVLRNGKPV